MGQMKELFTSMQEGLLQGSRMDKQIRGRIADEEYRLQSQAKEESNSQFICGSCGENCNEYTYNEDTDVDECNDCKISNN